MAAFIKGFLPTHLEIIQYRTTNKTQSPLRNMITLAPNRPWFAYKAMMDVADLRSERTRLEGEHARIVSDLQERQEDLMARVSVMDQSGSTLVTGLESRIVVFETQVIDLTRHLEAMRIDLTTEQGRTRTLNNERSALQARVDELTSELSCLQALRNELCASLQLSQAEAEGHRRMAANMNAAVSTEHRTNGKLKAKVQELQDQLRELGESQSRTVRDLESAQDALLQATLKHSTAKSKSTDLLCQVDSLSDTLSVVQKEKAALEVALTEALLKAEDAALVSEELRAAVASEQEKRRELEAELKRANALLFAADGRTAALLARGDSFKDCSVLFDVSDESCDESASLDISRFALELENELLREEEASAQSAQADLAAQLEAALAEVAHLKTREDALLKENTSLKSQLEEERQERNDAIFDVRDGLATQTSLGEENEDLKARLEATERTLLAIQECEATLHSELDEQYQYFQRELRAKAEEEQKVHFVIAELNREKRELSTNKNAVEDALRIQIRRCDELERQVTDLTVKFESPSSGVLSSPYPVTPQSKASFADKENLSMGSRLFSRISSMRRQSTLPLSHSANLNTPLSSKLASSSPSPSYIDSLLDC